MYPTYVPILRAKTGEFDAIKNLKGKYASAICLFLKYLELLKIQKN